MLFIQFKQRLWAEVDEYIEVTNACYCASHACRGRSPLLVASPGLVYKRIVNHGKGIPCYTSHSQCHVITASPVSKTKMATAILVESFRSDTFYQLQMQ